jgi:hypothetical protein
VEKVTQGVNTCVRAAHFPTSFFFFSFDGIYDHGVIMTAHLASEQLAHPGSNLKKFPKN